MWPTMRDEPRLIAAIEALTHQVARVAWAIEVQVFDADTEDVVEVQGAVPRSDVEAQGAVPRSDVEATPASHATISAYATDPCTRCGSQLVPVNWPACPACLEPQKEVGDG